MVQLASDAIVAAYTIVSMTARKAAAGREPTGARLSRCCSAAKRVGGRRLPGFTVSSSSGGAPSPFV